MVPLNFQNSNRSTAENSRYSGRSKENFKRTSGKEKNRKFGYTSQGSPLFWKFWKILFFLLLEVAEYSNRTFWLNGKCPWLLTKCYKNNHDISSVILSFSGGVCFYVRFNINFSLRPDNQCLENLYIEVRKLRSKCFRIANWYRPPSSLKCSENVQSRKRSLILKLWLINLMLKRLNFIY